MGRDEDGRDRVGPEDSALRRGGHGHYERTAR
jgi:hypothetical protein